MTSTKRVAIIQSSYIPWKGYFDMISRVDEFILLDDVQFTKRDWRNRNVIKTARGPQWLTIPVQTKGRYHQRINETAIADTGWAERHWKTLARAYSSAPFFADYSRTIQAMYQSATDPLLSNVNHRFLEGVCKLLGISTHLTWSTDYVSSGTKTERLLGLCRAANASVYLSGPRARAYLDEDQFADAGIRVEYMNYAGYSEYRQEHQPFEHGVTILDLIFATGPDARRFMTGASQENNSE